jgi:hypothetical protein
LLAAALDVDSTPVRRRPSLCHDGTPVVYSQEVRAGSRRSGFRLLSEPGGVGRTVPQQVDFTLGLVDRLLGDLEWRHAAADLNAIASAVLPADPTALGNWWGGVWLGLAQSDQHLDLRLYFNLRHGSLTARWQRVAAALGHFADDRLEKPLQALADGTAPHALPVGLGVVVRDGCVPVLRVYCGVHEPRIASLEALAPESGAPARATLALVVDRLGGPHGGFPAQSVTFGYDFVREASGLLRPEVARTKIDLSCQWLVPRDRSTFLEEAALLARDFSLDTGPLDRFAHDLEDCFGGFAPEYVSFTLGDPPPAMTLYAKPHSCAPA